MYVSIDIETTGLNPDTCDIIEFGAVIDDLTSAIDELPTFHRYITKNVFSGEPYALSMHAKKFERIAKLEQPYRYVSAEDLELSFYSWLKEQNIFDSTEEITVAGKNFANFDLLFLRKLPNWGTHIKINRRIIDPAVLYFHPLTMDALPNLNTCLKMAGVQKSVSHDAVDDARDVVACLRSKWKI